MGHAVRDTVAFRAPAGGRQIRPSGFWLLTVVALMMWSGLAVLLARAL